MAVVPKGKTIYIGSKRFKAGAELPASYKLKEKKKSAPVQNLRQENKD